MQTKAKAIEARFEICAMAPCAKGMQTVQAYFVRARNACDESVSFQNEQISCLIVSLPILPSAARQMQP